MLQRETQDQTDMRQIHTIGCIRPVHIQCAHFRMNGSVGKLHTYMCRCRDLHFFFDKVDTNIFVDR